MPFMLIIGIIWTLLPEKCQLLQLSLSSLAIQQDMLVQAFPSTSKSITGPWQLLLRMKRERACNLLLMFPQVLNEEKAIAECLQYLQGLAMPPHQIVVVDGGSKDR